MKKFKGWFQDYFGWWPQWQLFVVLAAYAILVILYSWVTPPFEGPDEPQHFAYITWLAEGKGFPPQGDAAWQTPVEQEAGQSPLYYLLGAVPARLLGVTESPVDYRPNPHFVGPFPRLSPDNDNRAIHYPGDASPLVGGWLALYLARVLTGAFGLLLLFAVYALTRQIFPELPLLALAAATITAVIPQVLFISSVASNDIPGAALSAVTLWLLVLLLLKATSPSPAIAVGMVYGLAILTKASAIMLIVPIAAGLLWLWLSRKRSLLGTVKIGLFIAAGAILIAGWWLIRSLILYGSPLGLETHDLTPWAISDPDNLAQIHQRWFEVFRSFWIALGWGTIRPPKIIYILLSVFTGVSLAGLIQSGVRRLREASSRPMDRAVILLLLTIAILSVGFSLELWMRRVSAPYGRLLFPALAAITVLLTTGWYKIHAKLPFLIAGVIFIVSLLAPFLLLKPAYMPPELLSSEEVDQLSPNVHVSFGSSPDNTVAELVHFDLLVQSVDADDVIPIRLCWRPLVQTDQPYSILVHIIGPGNSLIANRRTYPGLGKYPTTLWQPGNVFCDVVQVAVPKAILQTLVYKVEVGMLDIEHEERLNIFDDNGNVVPGLFLDEVRVVKLGQMEEYTPKSGDNKPIHLVSSSFDNTWHLGEENEFTLRWGIGESVDSDYQMFVHLREPDSTEIIAQADGPPLNGWYPTSWWQPGDIITDERIFPLPDSVPVGNYDLIVGFYNLSTGNRLGSEFPLGRVEVEP